MTKNELSVALDIKNLHFYYYQDHAVKNLSMKCYQKRITSIIGPSGCGKTSLLRCINRMHDLYPKHRYEGEIIFKGQNILDKSIDVAQLRSQIGMIFKKPTPFPMSIQENLAYALDLKGITNVTEVNDRIESLLKKTFLWEELSDNLKMNAGDLKEGQQQRLVIARALVVDPEILLFDDPTYSLDPRSTSQIEELIFEFKNKLTIVFVAHNIQQAARISDFTAFMYMGELVELNETNQIFTNPKNSLTEEYVTGRFG